MSLANKFGIPESLLDASKRMLEEANEYQKKVQAHMAKKGIKSLNDLTGDQKKKFFNDLDAMHKAKNEEVESVKEGTSVTDYTPKSQGGTRKELLAKYHKTKNPKDAEAARRAGATQKELQGVAEEVEPIEEAETAPNKDKNKLRVEVKAKPDSTKYHGHYEGKKYEVNVNKHHDQVDVHSHLSPEEVKKQNPHLGKKSANILSAHLKHYHRTQSKLDISSKHRGGQLYRDIHGGPNAHRLFYGHPYVKEEVEHVEEELKGDMHPDAHKVLKHIKPEHHGTYKPYLKKGTYKGDYKDRAAVLSAAEKAGHVKEEVESVELTQEDLDFIASLNKIEEGSGPKEKQKTPYRNINSPASRAAADKRREEMDKEEKSEKGKKLLGKIAAKNEEVDLDEEQLDELSKDTVASYAGKAGRTLGGNIQALSKAKEIGQMSYPQKSADQVKTTLKKSIANRKAGLDRAEKRLSENEEFDLDDFTVEEIEEYMQTEEFAQLDELSKETLGSYVKKRSHDVATQGALTRKHAMDSEAKKKENGGYTTKAVRDLDDKANRAFMKGWKHRQNIARAVDKIVNKA